MLKSVAVLFAREDSVYKTLPGCDVFDAKRNALTWRGGYPVVAHPPCRAWGRLRHFSRPAPGERELAFWAVRQVRDFGGVLEHPAASLLWRDAALPAPGERDAFGGWTLAVPQQWFGHKAEKHSLFYVVGCEPKDAPEIPFVLGEASYVIQSRKTGRPHVTKAEREHTPFQLAAWLVDLARKTQVGGLVHA